MRIDQIGGINPLNNVQNTKRTQNAGSVKSTPDSISVSAEAYYLKGIADETPDVRADLVAQIKEKIKDANYLNPQTISATADRIMQAYGI